MAPGPATYAGDLLIGGLVVTSFVVFAMGPIDATSLNSHIVTGLHRAQFAVTAGLVYEELIADVTNTVSWAQGASIDAAFRMAEARSCAIET